jgi:hypothetical protein
MGYYEHNKQELPDLDSFATSNNDFLKSIHAQASSRYLSPRQVIAAKTAWRHQQQGPVTYVSFDDDQAKFWIYVLHALDRATGGYASRNIEFNDSMRKAISKNKRLSQKQFDAVQKEMIRFRKALIRKNFEAGV